MKSPIVSSLINAAKYGYEYHRSSQFPELSFEENCRNNFLQFIANNNYENKFYTTSEVLTLLCNMKELCAEKAKIKEDYWRGATGYYIDKQSILSINENELLK